MKLTHLALSRPITVTMAFASAALIGTIAMRLLPLEYFPDIEFPVIWIDIPYYNSTPEEVERRITRPAEEMLATMGGIKRMRSESRENGAWIFLFFDWGQDLTVKGVEARDKLDAIRHRLPQDVQRLIVRKFSATESPILTLRISSERDLSGARDMLERNLQRRIQRLEGISKVELYGVEKKQIRLELSADRVAAHGIDLNQLREQLEKANFALSAGQITDRGRRYVVHPIGAWASLDDIGARVIGPQGLRLRDIAEVRYGNPVLTYGRHLNQRYAIGLDVYKETGANLVAVAERVMAEIDTISRLPEMQGVTLYAMENQGAGVRDSLRNLLEAGLLGALLSILVLYLFLRHLRMTLIVTLAVPFSMLITLGAMFFLGYSLNILTMMGLMLSVGMLVDNAVVITESIFRKRRETGDAVKASVLGVKEVGTAVLAGTLTTAIVFLPNVFGRQDQVTVFLSHVAITITIALFASLLIARTLIPLLVTHIRYEPVGDQKPGWVDHLAQRYCALLSWTLVHRPTVMLATLAVVIGSFIVIPKFGLVEFDFFPENQNRRLLLRYNLNGQYALPKVEAAVNVIEKYLFAGKDAFEIESVYSYYSTLRAESTILLKKGAAGEKETTQIKDAIRKDLPKIAIGRPSFEQQRAGSSEALGVQVKGDSAAQLRVLAEDVYRILETFEGIKDLQIDLGPTDREVRVKVDRDRARQNGLNSQDIAQAVAVAMRGQKLRPYRGRTGEVEVLLQFRAADRQDLARLFQIPIYTPDGRRLSLASVATWEIGTVPGTIKRDRRATTVTVKAALDGITTREARQLIERAMTQVEFPPGYGWQFGEAFDEEAEAQQVMIVNMLLAIVMIYIVMAALFESLLFPSAIIMTIVFSVVGVLWLFAATGTTFSIMAAIGILVLMGVVVNNGIVLIDHINQLRWGGLTRHQAIAQGARDRLRPILMTAGTTILGLVPLAAGSAQLGGDGPPYFPMARAIIGGLAFSTVVSLITLPTLYTLLDDLRDWSRRLWRAPAPADAESSPQRETA